MSLHNGDEQKNLSGKFLIGDRFHVKLRIFSPLFE